MKDKISINGSTLKWIAIILMAIDHFGASILENFVLNAWNTSPMSGYFYGSWNEIYSFDRILRMIGRPAFPIFCFLLIEGFTHTRDVKKYLLRLSIFAILSEIPFDLALWNRLFHWEHQNVFLTLAIGLFTIYVIQKYEKNVIVKILAIILGAGLAEVLHTDYGYFGVLFIVILYMTHQNRLWQCIAGAICCAWEGTAPLAFLFIWFYNGKRGKQPKWFFYYFYPAHLLLYYVIGGWILPKWIGF